MSELERRLRAIEPGLRFVARRQWNRVRNELRDAGSRIPQASDRPLLITGEFWTDTLAPREMYWLALEPSEVGVGGLSQSEQLAFFWPWLLAIRLAPTLERLDTLVSAVEQRDVKASLIARGLLPDSPTEIEIATVFTTDFITALHFSPELIRYRYPGLKDPIALRDRLMPVSAIEALAQATKPEGIATDNPSIAESTERNRFRDPALAESYRKNALAAAASGNAARAAILFAAAVRACSTGSSKSRADSKVALRSVVARLAETFSWNTERAEAWIIALQPLLHSAIEGHWSPAAKALYDLQRIAVDRKTQAYTIDPFRWLGSLGRRALLVPLHHARTAQTLLRLRKIGRHIRNAKLPAAALAPLQDLLTVEIECAEHTLRGALEPMVIKAFAEAGLTPKNVIERIALPKIIDELLDLTAERGFFRFGDLRDALARNALKIPDLAGPVEWVNGDALLRANAILARELDGVYYPAEIYLRSFQRGSSLAFGTVFGRWLTLYFLLPFGAAFMTVEFAKYVAHEIATLAEFFEHLFAAAPADTHGEHGHHGIALTPGTIGFIVGIGVVYLLLIHSKPARSIAGRVLEQLGHGFNAIFVTAPAFLWNSRPVRAIRRNPVANWLYRKSALPVLGAGAASGVAAIVDNHPEAKLAAGASAFLVLLIAGNTSVGTRGIERAADAARWTWIQLRTNFFPGLLSWLAWFFHEALAALDRLIYSIDEWFRFRHGQSTLRLTVKLVLGIVWFPIRYLLRFAVYLLVEPQINPLKHFPVVTVSHKLLLPMIPAIATATGIQRKWIATMMSGIPGIFGFLAWELRENWRLYSANRPKRIVPLAIGHHGETLRALLRPGFHSGTVPKQYAAIRKAIARAERTDDKPNLTRPLAALHQAEHAVRHFVEREFLAYFTATRVWAGIRFTCQRVELALGFIRVTIRAEDAEAEFVFELIESEITMTCQATAILIIATAEQREVWERATLGLGAMAAVPTEDPRLEWKNWLEFWSNKMPEADSIASEVSQAR